jgi:hypothetical protein
MHIPLTQREIKHILAWKEEAFWPDEERVLVKLRRALEHSESPKLSRVQVKIIQAWAEEQLGGHYGGTVVNPEERAILGKLSSALSNG